MPLQTHRALEKEEGREESTLRGGACRPLHLQPIALFIYSSAFSMPSWPAQSALRFSKCQEKAQYAAARAAVVWSGAEQNALNVMYTQQLNSLCANTYVQPHTRTHTPTHAHDEALAAHHCL